MSEPTKRCCHCKKFWSLGFFNVDKQTPDGLSRRCIDCAKQRANSDYQKKYKENPDYFSNSHLKSRFGITLSDYDNMSETQGGVCAICGNFEARPNVSRLSVDHDHETGKIRGLLCDRCNRMLGCAKDDVQILEQAIEYLRRYNHAG